MSQGKRLSWEDRKTIEEKIDQGYGREEIAALLLIDPTTVSREILRNRVSLAPIFKSKVKVIVCERFKTCKKRWLCEDLECPRQCRHCRTYACEVYCQDFVRIICTITQGYPHVCNTCHKLNRCPEPRFVYRADSAHKAYEKRACESRCGIDMSEAELVWLSDIITPLIRQGQSVPTILSNHPEISMAPSTLYKYIALGRIDARYIDLVRAVRCKKRTARALSRVSKHIEDERSYADFLDLGHEMCEFAFEMDTVIGRRGGKTLLTFCSRSDSVFYAQLLNKNTADEVKRALDTMEVEVKGKIDVLPLILLTDNGPEFMRAEQIEESFLYPGTLRASLYYCDPYSSWQKPHVENAHILLRRILPKKSSFDELTQEKVNLICSHINSYVRKELDWKSPFQRLEEKGLLNLMGALGLRVIEPDDINLTPGLIS